MLCMPILPCPYPGLWAGAGFDEVPHPLAGFDGLSEHVSTRVRQNPVTVEQLCPQAILKLEGR
jgi:hypothetical protein